MNVDEDELFNACALWVLVKSEEAGKGGMTATEISKAVKALSSSEKLDALARYQEHGEE